MNMLRGTRMAIVALAWMVSACGSHDSGTGPGAAVTPSEPHALMAGAMEVQDGPACPQGMVYSSWACCCNPCADGSTPLVAWGNLCYCRDATTSTGKPAAGLAACLGTNQCTAFCASNGLCAVVEANGIWQNDTACTESADCDLLCPPSAE